MIRALSPLIKRAVIVSAAATFLSSAAIGQTSNAAAEGQTSSTAGDESGLEQIIVTAQRYGTSLQTTPVSVTALSAMTLTDRQVVTVQDLVTQIPGVQLSSGTAPSSQMKITMRGARTETSGIRANGTVGVYIDNVIQPRPMGQFFSLFDVAQVEVLRGPQGTLYGRNTSGGAIKIQTKRPTYFWTGSGRVTAGNWDSLAANVYLSGPLIADKLAFSLSGEHRERDGFLYGLLDERRIGDEDISTQRLKLLYQPTETLAFDLAVYGTQDDSETSTPIPLLVLPGVVDPYAVPGRDLTVSELRQKHDQSTDQEGASLNAAWDITDDLQLVSISGYGKMRKYNHGNDSLTAALQQARGGVLDISGDNKVYLRDTWFTQEFNALYTGDRLNAVVGLYYFREDGWESGQTAGVATDLQESLVEAPAVFAQATYDISEEVSVLAGLRYTRESVDYFSHDFGSAEGPQIGHSVFNSTTPKLGINWQVNSSLFTYVSWTQGTKSGGFNTRTFAGELQPTPYGAEWVDSYELGGKFMSEDGRFRLNATLFRADYTDQQLATILSGDGWSGFFWLNAGESRVQGLELETDWQVLDNLTLYAIMAFQDGKYTKPFECRNQYGITMDCTDNHLKGVPERKSSVGFKFTPTIPLLPGSLTINGVWDHNSVMYNTTANPLPGFEEYGPTPALDLFNASVHWTDNEDHWSASLDVRNLTDKSYVHTGIWRSHPVSPGVDGYVGRPREVLVRVGYAF